MLLPLKTLLGHKLSAKDGEIGHVSDFYFDDQSWNIRYLVADTGSWLNSRLVLLSPHAFGQWDRAGQTLQINLTRQQIEASPSTDRHRPVSRQFEMDYYAYYGWPAYWVGDGFGGMGGTPALVPIPLQNPPRAAKKHHGHNQRDDLHLHSARAIKGYQLQAHDGDIGHVSDLVANDKTWHLDQLAVETGHWYAGKEVLIETDRALQVSYEDAKVFVNLTQADIKKAADHAVARPH